MLSCEHADRLCRYTPVARAAATNGTNSETIIVTHDEVCRLIEQDAAKRWVQRHEVRVVDRGVRANGEMVYEYSRPPPKKATAAREAEAKRNAAAMPFCVIYGKS